MTELQIVMEALSNLGTGAQNAFIAWCIKEVVGYLISAGTVLIVFMLIYRAIREIHMRVVAHEENMAEIDSRWEHDRQTIRELSTKIRKLTESGNSSPV